VRMYSYELVFAISKDVETKPLPALTLRLTAIPPNIDHIQTDTYVFIRIADSLGLFRHTLKVNTPLSLLRRFFQRAIYS